MRSNRHAHLISQFNQPPPNGSTQNPDAMLSRDPGLVSTGDQDVPGQTMRLSQSSDATRRHFASRVSATMRMKTPIFTHRRTAVYARPWLD
jgi:hypothetical protein